MTQETEAPGGATPGGAPAAGGGTGHTSHRMARRRGLQLSLVAVVAVVAVVVALIVVKLNPTNRPGASASGPAPAAVGTSLAQVSAETLAQVGAGSPKALTAVKGPPLTAAGHPELLYVGANYCPYCAAERWPLAVALTRFGTLGGLQTTTSASNDVFPDTPTLSFARATFASTVHAFSAVEEQDRDGNPLQSPTASQQSLIGTYDVVAGQRGHPIPFVDFGNRFTLSGAQFDPGVLKGLSAPQVAAALNDPGSNVAQQIGRAANVITAGLCVLTGGRPASACTGSVVQAASAQLTAAGGSGPGTR